MKVKYTIYYGSIKGQVIGRWEDGWERLEAHGDVGERV